MFERSIGWIRSGAWRPRRIGRVVALGAGMACAAGAAAEGDAPPVGPAPCPPGMEIPCASTGPSGGAGPGPGVTCACGPGYWQRLRPVVTAHPAEPIAESEASVHVNGTRWRVQRFAEARAGSADVEVRAYGASTFWRAGSLARSAAARYTVLASEAWIGSGVPCPRVVELVATGGGGMSLALTCAAAQGCGATGTASISGSCASLGNAAAALETRSLDGTVAYSAASSTTDVRGNFGAEMDDNSATIKGRITRHIEWRVQGAGNLSGSAAYTVRNECTYCAFTNRAVIRRANGVAVAAGGATVDNNGSASFDLRAFVDLVVP